MATDEDWLRRAIEESRLSTPSATHYAVGAVLVDADGDVLATGYTGELLPTYHAEEAALAKLAGRAELDLSGATLYTTLEPCTTRRSRPDPCCTLVLRAGIGRVVLALREPALFADCDAVETLQRQGIEVVELAHLAGAVRSVNAHLLAPAA